MQDRKYILLIVLFGSSFLAALAAGSASGASVPSYGYEIVAAYPHDNKAFTQGLDYGQGLLYEGTGLYGGSTARIVELETGRILKQINLPNDLFGEGLSLWKDRLIQLTWQSGVGLIYNQESLNSIGEFTYPGEGWGLTSDGERLIMSDGTDSLYLLDPQSLQMAGQVKVSCNGVPVNGLNELEYVEGEIYANIFPTSLVAIISLQGDVTAWIDFSTLAREVSGGGNIDVLNGIAYDPEGKRLFVTGKLWPQLFQVRIQRGEAEKGS